MKKKPGCTVIMAHLVGVSLLPVTWPYYAYLAGKEVVPPVARGAESVLKPAYANLVAIIDGAIESIEFSIRYKNNPAWVDDKALYRWVRAKHLKAHRTQIRDQYMK